MGHADVADRHGRGGGDSILNLKVHNKISKRKGRYIYF